MPRSSFSSTVAGWAKMAEGRNTAVFQEAGVRLAAAIRQSRQEGGHLPYERGNLQRSLAASTIGPPAVLWRQKEFGGSLERIAEVIRGASIGQTIWLGFQAPYAVKVEQGESGGFFALGAQRWPQIVLEAAQSVKSRTGG